MKPFHHYTKTSAGLPNKRDKVFAELCPLII